MMEIYPYGGILAYLKYHYLDGVMLQTLMLIDKTRYNYKDSKDKEKSPIKASGKVKSKEETLAMLSNFDLGGNPEIERVRNEIGE